MCSIPCSIADPMAERAPGTDRTRPESSNSPRASTSILGAVALSMICPDPSKMAKAIARSKVAPFLFSRQQG